MYKVTVYRKAREMFSGQVRFLKRESPSAAHRLVLSYKKSLNRIAENPFQFPFADELDVPDIPRNTYRKCLFEERYKALFQVGEGEVFVDAVIDSRMENKDL
jgi:plasmid stabilization system protein ParE